MNTLSLSRDRRDIQNIVTTDEQVGKFIEDLGTAALLALFEHDVEAAVKAYEGSTILCVVVEFDHHCVSFDKL
jgi:hypothetical protein